MNYKTLQWGTIAEGGNRDINTVGSEKRKILSIFFYFKQADTSLDDERYRRP